MHLEKVRIKPRFPALQEDSLPAGPQGKTTKKYKTPSKLPVTFLT